MTVKTFQELWSRISDMPEDQIEAITAILDELDRARDLHPTWPTDAVHAAAVMVEEAGETLKEAINFHYKGKQPLHKQRMKDEAVQTGAMAIRVLMGMNKYAVSR